MSWKAAQVAGAATTTVGTCPCSPADDECAGQVVCERNWSIYGHTKTNKLAHAAVYCHEVLHLRDKLQKVSYQQKLHKWENDSDSQASDDDKDLMA